MSKIAIIGGGPSGFMAAVVAAENNPGNSYEILEKGEPLKTILWTGGGRCNLTNEIYDYKELASNFPRGEKFLYSVFSKFGVRETIEWFNSHGIPLYTQNDNRVFPRSDDANTVRDFFLNRTKELKVKVKPHKQVIDIVYKNDKFYINTGSFPEEYDKVLISTGGNYRKLPDTGYDLARKLGHTVTDLKPALTAFMVKEIWPASLAGVTIKNAEIIAEFKGERAASARGDFVFTHSGISGPAVFRISSYCAFLNYDECSPLILKLNFVPDMSIENFEKDLMSELEQNSKKSIINIISKYVPRSVAETLLGIELIDSEKKANQISRDERKTIVSLLTSAILSAVSPKPDGEIVTAGGVELNEVDSRTMQSKLVNGLYFSGEVLNIDGLTGGFNLQNAWSTGYLAGLSISA